MYSLCLSHPPLTVTPCSCTMGAVYQEYKDKDEYLYITYNGDSVFGSLSPC